MVVNGDNVVATGLFAEHYQKYNVFWAGENGKTIMFQNEMPYDPPNQAAWQHDGVLGWAAYKVADWVKTHEGWGLGSYCFLNVDPTIHASRAFEVPVTPGVKLHDILSLSITNHGTIDHVVNDVGRADAPGHDARSTSSRTRSAISRRHGACESGPHVVLGLAQDVAVVVAGAEEETRLRSLQQAIRPVVRFGLGLGAGRRHQPAEGLDRRQPEVGRAHLGEDVGKGRYELEPGFMCEDAAFRASHAGS